VVVDRVAVVAVNCSDSALGALRMREDLASVIARAEP
jgi:hypothetical protein